MHRDRRIEAPAKVNLVLRVLDRRPDGYHNLWSILQTVGLTDTLTLRAAGPRGHVALSCSDPELPTDERNLVVRAARAVLTLAGADTGVAIHLDKRIPMGGGLGGGSSDAAATILGLNALLNLGWTVATMTDIGKTLGSDVPFFLYAPTALITGRGETVSPLRLTDARWIALANPGFPIATQAAYAQLALSRSGIEPVSPALERLATAGSLTWEEVLPLLHNDFETALAPTHPVLEELRRALCRLGAESALLSGSGATVFGVFRNEAGARESAARLAADRGLWTAAVPAGGALSVG